VDGSELARTFFTNAALVGAAMCSACLMRFTRHAAHRLVDQAESDGYDMTTPRLAHHLHRALGHMKEACDISGDVGSVVVIRIGGERLGYERAGVVDQRIEAAEAI
jgi:hypothetical protein